MDIELKIGGIPIDPVKYTDIEKYTNVTVIISEGPNGELTCGWSRQPNTEYFDLRGDINEGIQ